MAEVHSENEAGQKDGGATAVGSMGDGGGIQSGGVQRDKKRRVVQEINGIWGRNPTGGRNPVDQATGLCNSFGGRRS